MKSVAFSEKDSYKWIVLMVSCLLMLTFAISLQALPPLFRFMMKDIPFTNSQSGLLMGAYAIPGVLLPFFVAFLASRYNQKILLVAALITMIGGLIAFSFASSFTTLLIYRLIIGIGATFFIVLAPLLITVFFDERNMGTAMGIFNMAVPLGTVFSANFFGFIGQHMDWRHIIIGIAAFVGIILAVVLFTLYVPNNQNQNKTISPGGNFSFGLSPWLLAFLWMIANALLLAYVTFGPQFYQSFGISNQQAGFLTSLIMMVPIFLSPVAGIGIDKIKNEKLLLIFGFSLLAIAFGFLIKPFISLTLWAIILGVGFSPIPVFVFAMLPKMVKPHQVGIGLGLLTAASNLGITMGPSVFGRFLDMTGGFTVGFIVLCVAAIVSVFISFGLRTEN